MFNNTPGGIGTLINCPVAQDGIWAGEKCIPGIDRRLLAFGIRKTCKTALSYQILTPMPLNGLRSVLIQGAVGVASWNGFFREVRLAEVDTGELYKA